MLRGESVADAAGSAGNNSAEGVNIENISGGTASSVTEEPLNSSTVNPSPSESNITDTDREPNESQRYAQQSQENFAVQPPPSTLPPPRPPPSTEAAPPIDEDSLIEEQIFNTIAGTIPSAGSISVLRIRTTEDAANTLIRDIASNSVTFSDLVQTAQNLPAIQRTTQTIPARPRRVLYRVMDRPRANNNNNNRARNNNNTNATNALITVRNQLFYTLFVKAALFYARTFPKPVRRFLEFFFLLLVSVALSIESCDLF